MMQFLKSILSRGKKDKMEDPQKEIDEIKSRLQYLEKRVDVATEAISELSIGLSNVSIATKMLAQDVSALTMILESIQAAVMPDDKMNFTWNSDDDGDDYLN